MRFFLVPAVLLLFVGVSLAPAQDAGKADAIRCHYCGVELLPQAQDYVDDTGHHCCQKCAAKHAPAATDGGYDLATTKRLTGNWGGLRSDMDDAGINMVLKLGSVTEWNARGGVNTHNALENAGEMNYIFEFDMAKLMGVAGGSFYLRGIQTWGDPIRGDVGSLSNPYGGPGGGTCREIYLKKYWWRQRLFDDRLEFRLGKLEAKDVIDNVAYAKSTGGQFVNTWLELNPTIPNVSSLGAFAKVWPTDWFYAEAIVLDSDIGDTTCTRGTGGWDTAFHDDAHFRLFTEVGILPHHLPNVTSLPGHYRLGAWYDPRLKAEYDDITVPDVSGSDVGWYLSFDQMVWREESDPKCKQGLGVFARYGWADGKVNLINHFWSVGASYQGLIPSRDSDTLGFGIAQSILSKDLRRHVNDLADRETVYDLYYKIIVTPWCKVTPDLQVITNPSGSKDARDAVTAGIRVEINL